MVEVSACSAEVLIQGFRVWLRSELAANHPQRTDREEVQKNKEALPRLHGDQTGPRQRLGPAAVRAFRGFGPPQQIQPSVPLKARWKGMVNSSRGPCPASPCDPPKLGPCLSPWVRPTLRSPLQIARG